MRDTIHTQEWRRVVAAIPSGSVATPNARSLLFYSNLQGIRHYTVEQFNEDEKEFAALVARATTEWIVLPKYSLYSALVHVVDASSTYQRFAEFEHTLIYRSVNAGVFK